MKKEYKVELSLEQMDIIITALRKYPDVTNDTEEDLIKIIIGNLMYTESKIYKNS